MRKTDFLIVGQGFAGTALALQLLRLKQDVLVMDDASPTSSSRISTGILNPLTGAKLLKSWKADEALAVAKEFYKYAEEFTGSSFFSLKTVLHIFNSISEQNDGIARSGEAGMEDYLFPVEDGEVPEPEKLKMLFGALWIKGGGFLDARVYLQSVKQYLEENDSIIFKNINPEKIKFFNNYVEVDDVQAKQVIICSGSFGLTKALFPMVKLLPVKGEMLWIDVPQLQTEQIFHKGIFLIPYNGKYMCSGTYRKAIESVETTVEAHRELDEKLKNLLNIPYHIEKQQAAIRPMLPDKIPVIGRHPQQPRLCVFNGLGSRGVLFAPLMAQQLANLLLHEKPVYKEVDLQRFNR